MTSLAASSWPAPQGAPWSALAPSGLEQLVLAATAAAPRRGVRRTLASALRGVMKAWRSAPVDVEVYGFKARLHHRENLADKRALFYPRFWDAAEREILASLVRPGFRFIDVGANTGLYSLFVAARAGDDATIVAVEPQPEVREWLAFNVAANGFGAIHIVDAAIAAGPGTARLSLPARNRGAASIARSVEPKGVEGPTIEVPTLGILDVMDHYGIERADALKIDIEGAEEQALIPFFEACPAERLPAHIFMELSSHLWKVDCVELAKQQGYVELTRTHMNVVLKRA